MALSPSVLGLETQLDCCIPTEDLGVREIRVGILNWSLTFGVTDFGNTLSFSETHFLRENGNNMPTRVAEERKWDSKVPGPQQELKARPMSPRS